MKLLSIKLWKIFSLKTKFFKELAVPVLKYLIRARNKHLKDKDSAKRQKYLVFAVENRFYDIFFDLSKDRCME